MANPWQCPNCGNEVKNPETRSKPVLWAGLFALFVGVCWIATVATKPASQVSELACFFPALLFFLGIVGIVFWVVTKNQSKTGKFKNITCPVCKSTWEPAEVKSSVKQPVENQYSPSPTSSSLPKVQGVLIISSQSIEKSVLQTLAQQILDAQKTKGYGFAEGCKVVFDTGVGRVADDEMYTYGKIRSSFSEFGDAEVVKRTKTYPFSFPGGASGKFYVLYERRH